MEQQIIHLKKELHTIKNKKVKQSNILAKFDKFGNKVLMLETSKEVDEEKVTKEKIYHFQGILLLHFHKV